MVNSCGFSVSESTRIHRMVGNSSTVETRISRPRIGRRERELAPDLRCARRQAAPATDALFFERILYVSDWKFNAEKRGSAAGRLLRALRPLLLGGRGQDLSRGRPRRWGYSCRKIWRVCSRSLCPVRAGRARTCRNGAAGSPNEREEGLTACCCCCCCYSRPSAAARRI